jgi:hypothetical protein
MTGPTGGGTWRIVMSDVLLLDRLPEYIQSSIKSGLDVRVHCPKCDGGQTAELSLSIRSMGEGIVKLSCWRASCNWYATTITDPNAKIHSRKVKEANYYRDPVYGLAGDMLFRQERGHVTRTFTTPKRCMTYKATAAPFLDWWRHDYAGDPRPLVIVEDTLSAARAYGAGFDAVALLGTNISVDDAKEISVYTRDKRNTYLALDRDAFLKALKLASRHAHIIPMKPVCLDKDIKNMDTDKDIQNLFGAQDDRRDSAVGSSTTQETGV